VLDSVRGRYLGRLKVPIRTQRETRQVQAHTRFRVHTRVHSCSSVHRLPRDKARRWSKPAKTGVVEANALAVGLWLFRLPASSDITRAGISGARVRLSFPPDFFWGE